MADCVSRDRAVQRVYGYSSQVVSHFNTLTFDTVPMHAEGISQKRFSPEYVSLSHSFIHDSLRKEPRPKLVKTFFFWSNVKIHNASLDRFAHQSSSSKMFYTRPDLKCRILLVNLLVCNMCLTGILMVGEK